MRHYIRHIDPSASDCHHGRTTCIANQHPDDEPDQPPGHGASCTLAGCPNCADLNLPCKNDLPADDLDLNLSGTWNGLCHNHCRPSPGQ
jgi:hypothetical protein